MIGHRSMIQNMTHLWCGSSFFKPWGWESTNGTVESRTCTAWQRYQRRLIQPKSRLKTLKVAPSLTTLTFWPPNGQSKIQREDQHLEQMQHFDLSDFLNLSTFPHDCVLPSLKICWSCVILSFSSISSIYGLFAIPYPICFFVAADIHSCACEAIGCIEIPSFLVRHAILIRYIAPCSKSHFCLREQTKKVVIHNSHASSYSLGWQTNDQALFCTNARL